MRRMSRPRLPYLHRAALAGSILAVTACQGPGGVELLRTEWAPADAPFDAVMLADNFERIALRHEANPRLAGGKDNWRPNPLKRWSGPLRYQLYGNAVTPQDRAETRRLMDRIAGLTGLEIAEADTEVNFVILITTPQERDHYGAHLATVAPPLAKVYELWRRSPQIRCAGGAFSPAATPGSYNAAVVVIGGETRGLPRRACLHEEIVQSLGLANDDGRVRPSIFNDDGEFALLTRHDAFLLRILYDPRLLPGMTDAEAMPVVRQIVAELDLAADP